MRVRALNAFGKLFKFCVTISFVPCARSKSTFNVKNDFMHRNEDRIWFRMKTKRNRNFQHPFEEFRFLFDSIWNRCDFITHNMLINSVDIKRNHKPTYYNCSNIYIDFSSSGTNENKLIATHHKSVSANGTMHHYNYYS